jgi:hypothetical protein
MVLDYKITVDGVRVTFTVNNIDAEAIAALKMDGSTTAVIRRAASYSSSVVVYSDHIVMRATGTDWNSFGTATKAKAFAAKVTKAIEDLVKVKPAVAKVVSIDDHFRYNFKVNTKTHVVTFSITHQSPEFTEFVKNSGKAGKLESCSCPEMASDTLYIKGDGIEAPNEKSFSTNKEAVAGIKKYTGWINDTAASFLEQICGKSVVNYPVKKFDPKTAPYGAFFLYDTEDKDFVSVVRTSTGIIKYVLNGHPQTTISATLANRCVVVSAEQVAIGATKLIDTGIVPKSKVWTNCKFL